MKCRWCGLVIHPSSTKFTAAALGFVPFEDGAGSLYCEGHIEGCSACDDGESHPHEPEETP